MHALSRYNAEGVQAESFMPIALVLMLRCALQVVVLHGVVSPTLLASLF